MDILFKYLCTANMPADIMTKALAHPKHDKFTALLGLASHCGNSPSPQWGEVLKIMWYPFVHIHSHTSTNCVPVDNTLIVGCIYAPYKVNPNIFHFYFDFLDIFHHTSMHPLLRNIYEFYLIFYDFISSSIIYNNYLYSRRHFLFWFHLAPDLLILSSCPELKSRPCMRS